MVQWITGDCVHCGKETKIMLENSDEFFVCREHLEEYNFK
jgi:hypothetical protein